MAAICDYCESEMVKGGHCKGGIDLDATEESIRLFADELRDCHDCGVGPGANHHPGCDVEQCARCGRQAIGCDCIYEVNGYDMDTLEEKHPEIYNGGPTDGMYAKWEAELAKGKRARWTGMWPGEIECRKLGWFCRDLHLDGSLPTPENPMKIGGGNMLWHNPCTADEPNASADLNRWVREGCPTGEALKALLAGSVAP